VYASWVTYLHYFAPAGHFTLATNKGEQTNIILPDGSSAWLNVDTRITYSTFVRQKKQGTYRERRGILQRQKRCGKNPLLFMCRIWM
jgi:hypothetical protein